jgi:hypothetical protein
VNASGLVTLSVAANHLTGWNAFDWFFHILFAILGWIAVAAPVYVMHRVETTSVPQSPPPAAPVTVVGASPAAAAPETSSDWQYYVMAVCIGIGGAILGATFGWITARHIANAFLVFAWWMLPLLCGAAVTMYWVVEERPSREKRSRTGWAVAVSALVYGAAGILILGADLITRLAAQASLSSDAMIALVLIGVLGWALWIFSPRRRARRGS